MPVIIDLPMSDSYADPVAEGERLPTAPWGQDPEQGWVRRQATRPANMWAAELDGYVPTQEDRDQWRAEAIDDPVRELMSVGSSFGWCEGVVLSDGTQAPANPCFHTPHDGQY